MFYSCNRELRIDLAHDATVGERCRKLKFFLRLHQDPSMSSSKQRVMGERLHLHTKRSGNGDDVVVLVVIRITDDQVLNGQHLRVQHTYGTIDVSSFLIQQGEGEVEEEDSNGSTTAWCSWCSSTPTGLRQARTEEERCWGGEGLRLDLCLQPSPHPSIYRGRGKGAGPSRWDLEGGGGQG